MNVQIWNKLCNSIICILSVTTNIWKTRWNSNSCVLKQEKESVPEATPPAAVQHQPAVLPVPPDTSPAVIQLCRYNHNYPAQPAQQCSETVVPVQQYNYLAQPAQAAGVNSDQWCTAPPATQEAQGTQHSRILWCKLYYYYFIHFLFTSYYIYMY